MSKPATLSVDDRKTLVRELAQYVHDPLGAVLFGFPWGKGELETSTGPRKWACELLDSVGAHLRNPETRYRVGRFSVPSGHGTGKSATVGHIIWWGLSTFEDCRVIVTANTKTQLDTKTQPEVAKWFRLALTSKADFYEVNVASIKSNDPDHDRNWRCDFIPWSDDNPQAFAGAHNAGKRLIIIVDEASEVSDAIYKVIEGALTDANTEILFFMFSQPTLPAGFFYDACFGNQKHRWKSWHLKSAEVEGTSKEEIAESIAVYGEDSDHVRVRYLGLPPKSASGQFIDQDLIKAAQGRNVVVLADEPLVAGVDFAWGGSDDNVIRFRCGLDARSVLPIKVKGELTRDPAVMTGKLADVLSREYEVQGRKKKVAMLFLDSAGIAAPVEARLRQMGFENIMTVNFGADSTNPRCAYMRDFMWSEMKEWLRNGAIDKDAALEADLGKPILISDPKNRIKLEPKDVMKKRLAKLGIDSGSPDDGDGLSLTFAMPIAPRAPVSEGRERYRGSWMG